MGRSLSTKLVYGYDLGGESDDDGWKFNLKSKVVGKGTDWSYTLNTVAWPEWVELDDEDEPSDFISQAEDRLVREIAKFNEEWTSGDSGYYERRNAAKKLSGLDILDFELYGVSDYTSWAFGVDLGSAYAIHAVDVTKLAGTELAKYDDLLRRALEALEIKPTDQPKPHLLSLASYF